MQYPVAEVPVESHCVRRLFMCFSYANDRLLPALHTYWLVLEEFYRAREIIPDQAVVERRARIKKLSKRLLESQVFSLVASFLDFKQVLEL